MLEPDTLNAIVKAYDQLFKVPEKAVPLSAKKCQHIKMVKNSKIIQLNGISSRKKGSIVKFIGKHKLGQVEYMLDLLTVCGTYYWCAVNILENVQQINGNYIINSISSCRVSVHVSELTEPLVTCNYNGRVLNKI